MTSVGPSAPFSNGNALGRNKIIYALRAHDVVASHHETGGTWAGATEALKNGYGRVAAWIGPGSGAGNSALVQRGAAELFDLDRVGELLQESVDRPTAKVEPLGDQLTLEF